MFWIVFGLVVFGLFFVKIVLGVRIDSSEQEDQPTKIHSSANPSSIISILPASDSSFSIYPVKSIVQTDVKTTDVPQEAPIETVEQITDEIPNISAPISSKSICAKKRQALRQKQIEKRFKIREKPIEKKPSSRIIGFIESDEEEEEGDDDIFESQQIHDSIEDELFGIKKSSNVEQKSEPIIIPLEEIIEFQTRKQDMQQSLQNAFTIFYSTTLPQTQHEKQEIQKQIQIAQKEAIQNFEMNLKQFDERGLNCVAQLEKESLERKQQSLANAKARESKYSRTEEVIRLENERKREEEAKRIAAEQAKKKKEEEERIAAEKKRQEEAAAKEAENKRKQAEAKAAALAQQQQQQQTTSTASATSAAKPTVTSGESLSIPEYISPEAYLQSQKRIQLVETIAAQVKAKTKEIMTTPVQYFSSEMDPSSGRTLRPKQENQALKQAMIYLRKQINACSTENINTMKRHIGNEIVAPIVHSKPEVKTYLFYLISELMYQQSQQITADETKPLLLAEIILELSMKNLDFVDIVLGFLNQKCIYLIPKLIKQQPNWDVITYHKQLKYIDDGTESDDAFTNRMKNIVAIYAGIFAFSPKTLPPTHPFHISHAWTYLARILNLDPSFDPNISCILQVVLTTFSHRLKTEYTKQFMKLILFLKDNYYARIIKVKGRSTNTFLINMATTIDKLLKNQPVESEYIRMKRIL